MRRKLLKLAAVLALVPGLALAEGPSRQNATVTADLAAGPDEVWAYIGDFQDLTWHPAVFSQTGMGGNDIGATRRLVLGEAGGPTIDEVLDGYDAGKMSYSYRIAEVAVETLPVTNYASRLTVMPRDGGGSTVEWSGAFDRGDPGNDPPAELNDAAAVAAVTGIYEAGMGALVERFGAPGT